MKTNKILTFVITLVFACISMLACFPSVIAGAQTITLTESDYASAKEVLKTICPDMPLGEGEVTTRAEFIAAVTMLLNIPMTEVADTGFSDVAPTDAYAANIKYAADLGLISNVDLFYPTSPVTYAQAVKIVMTAAGYGKKAEFMGGFPTGYLLMANEAGVGLNLELTNDDNLSHADAIALIYDAATTDIMEATSFGSSYEYAIREGKNLLSTYHHIYMAEGIVEANENTGLLSMTATAGENRIKINGKIFKGEGYQNFIGKKARVLYNDENSNAIVYAYEMDNTITEYTEKDNLSISGTTLTVVPQEKGKNEKYKLEASYSLIYNGKYYGAADYNTVINPTAGTVSLVDNDDDGVIEVIIVKDFQYGVIGNVNEFEEKIYDKYKKNGMLDLGNDSVKYLVTEQDGALISLGELEANDIIGYVASKDNKFYEIVRFDSKVGGTYEMLKSNNKIVVKGEEYTLSSYYTTYVKGLSDLKIGTEVIIYLGASNQVVYVDEFSTDIKYGVLVAGGQEGGIDGNCRAKIYSQDGEMLELSFAKKVKFNGTSSLITTVLPQINSVIANSDVSQRVVKFSLNADGEINKLYTTVANTQGTNVLLKENIAESRPVLYSDNNSADVGNDAKKLVYKGGVFYPLFAVSASGIIMKVAGSETNRNDNKSYTLSSTAILNEEDQESMVAYGYDVDKNGAAFIIIPQTEASTTVSGEPASAIVESVHLGLNPDGLEVAVAKIYRGGKWDVYYSNDDTKSAVLALKPGDIIAFVADSFNEIVALETHFSYGNGKTFYTPRATYNSNGTINKEGDVAPVPVIGYQSKVVGYVGGYIYNFSGGKATIIRADRVDTYKDINAVASAASFGLTEVYPVSLSASKTVFVKFINDRATGKTISAEVYKEADMNSLETFFNSGTSADYLVSRERYHSVSLNIVYVNEYVN